MAYRMHKQEKTAVILLHWNTRKQDSRTLSLFTLLWVKSMNLTKKRNLSSTETFTCKKLKFTFKCKKKVISHKKGENILKQGNFYYLIIT